MGVPLLFYVVSDIYALFFVGIFCNLITVLYFCGDTHISCLGLGCCILSYVKQ